MAARKLSDADRAALVAACHVDGGPGIVEIAKRFRITRGRVYQILAEERQTSRPALAERVAILERRVALLELA